MSSKALWEAYIRFACIPLACGSVNYFVQHLRRTVFFWEKRSEAWFPAALGPYISLI